MKTREAPQLPAPRLVCHSWEEAADNNDGSQDWYQPVTACNEEYLLLGPGFGGGLAKTNPLLTEVPIFVQDANWSDELQTEFF